ncbi:MAG: hypothetical protein ABSH51_15500 [Solirubrobacteraceae bacterium]|jgi:hypothetical protein
MSVLLVAASEPSKVPFFILGGLLVVWAVALAAIGLSRPEFPNSAGGQRGVIAVSLVLIVLAIGAAIATA